MRRFIPRLEIALLMACITCVWEPAFTLAQGIQLPVPQDVQVEGVITGFDVRTREIAIGGDRGVFVASLDPVRRSRDGRIVGGIPPVRIEIRAVDTTRVLDDDLLVRTIVKIRERREVTEPVNEIEVIRALPANGFSEPGDGDADLVIPRIDEANPVREGLPPMIRQRRREPQGDKSDDEALETLIVAGRITSVRPGRVTIAVPVDGSTQRVILPTNDDTFVRMVTDDLRRAAVGDSIQAEGVSVEPNRFFATELLISHVDERLRERGWKDPRDAAAIAEGGDAALTTPTKDKAGNDDKPADPFEIVKREREAAAAGSPAADEKKAAPKAIYHGRTVRIN